jgi:hypothetical protein
MGEKRENIINCVHSWYLIPLLVLRKYNFIFKIFMFFTVYKNTGLDSLSLLSQIPKVGRLSYSNTFILLGFHF